MIKINKFTVAGCRLPVRLARANIIEKDDKRNEKERGLYFSLNERKSNEFVLKGRYITVAWGN